MKQKIPHVSRRYLAVLRVFCAVVIFGFTRTTWAEDGITADKILIGQSTSVTGQGAIRVKKLLEGHRLFFDNLNATGGVFGRKIEFIVYDDEYDPQKTSENTRKLIVDDKVFALFKYYGTPTLRAAMPLLEKADVPMIAPSSGDQDLRTTIRKNIFLVKAGFFGEAELMVEALKKRGIKRIALFYQDDSFGNDGKNGVQKAIANQDMKLVAVGTYKRNTVEIESAIEAIMKEKPEAVLLWAVATPAIAFVKAAQKHKFKPIFFSNSALAVDDYSSLVQDGMQTMGIPLPDSEFEIAKSYSDAAAKAGQQPNASAFEGYVDAAVLVAALKKAGKDLTRSNFRQSLETMQNFDIGGLKISFSPKRHQGLEKPFLVEIKKGKFIPAQ